MSFNSNSTFIINDSVAYVKDKFKDQYNIMFLVDESEGDLDKVFIAKGSSYYIWNSIVDGLNYSQIIQNLKDLFDPFGDAEIKQLDEFLTVISNRGFVECKE